MWRINNKTLFQKGITLKVGKVYETTEGILRVEYVGNDQYSPPKWIDFSTYESGKFDVKPFACHSEGYFKSIIIRELSKEELIIMAV